MNDTSMGYCMMENTYSALYEASDRMSDATSDTEIKYRKLLVRLCRDIVEENEEFLDG